jgi:hypothetical protein
MIEECHPQMREGSAGEVLGGPRPNLYLFTFDRLSLKFSYLTVGTEDVLVSWVMLGKSAWS